MTEHVTSDEVVNTKTSIEVALPEDALDILQVQQSAYLDSYPNPQLGITVNDVKEKVDNITTDVNIKKIQENIRSSTATQWWVAKSDGKIIGFVTAKKTDDNHRISRLFVLPEHQGKGAGTKLLQTSVSWLGTNEAIGLQVVSHSNAAIAFYKKFGFIESGTGKPIKLPSGKSIPTTEMSLAPK